MLHSLRSWTELKAEKVFLANIKSAEYEFLSPNTTNTSQVAHQIIVRNVTGNSFEQDPSGFLENLNGRAHHDDGEQKRDYRIDEFRLRLMNRKANETDETA